MNAEKRTDRWRDTTLGEAFSFEYGKALKKEQRNETGIYPVVGSNGPVGLHDSFLVKGPGIVVGRKGAAGEVSYISSDFWPIDTTYYIRPKQECDIKFAYYLLKSLRLNQFEKSTAIPGLNRNDAYQHRILLPPVTEQQQIVSKIEELFSELDKGIESLKTARQQLKVYRQSVLKWAFEGKLTNDNIKDGELPEGWKWMKLGDFIERIEAGKSFKCDERPPREGEVGVLKVSAVTWGEFNELESKTVVDTSKINQSYFVKKGDFLLSRANTIELVGNAVIVKIEAKQLMLSDKTLRIVFSAKLNKYYALYYLRCRKGRMEIERLSTGNQESMRNIGQERIKQIQIAVPNSFSEQNRIVQEIESRLSIADKLEETINQSLQQAETLRQSILKKAFEGKLVVQEEQEEVTKVIELTPATVNNDANFARKVLAANIIAKCCGKDSFGITKFQKILHVVEYHAQLDFDSHYYQMAAGPLDKFIYTFKAEAKEKDWFTTNMVGEQERFELGMNLSELSLKFSDYFQEKKTIINAVISFMNPMRLRDAELASTVYAVWNNFLIRDEHFTDTELMKGVYNWSPEKAKYTEAEILAMKGKMIKTGIVPLGFGKEILKKEIINI